MIDLSLSLPESLHAHLCVEAGQRASTPVNYIQQLIEEDVQRKAHNTHTALAAHLQECAAALDAGKGVALDVSTIIAAGRRRRADNA
jgi:hypothetical protein